MEPQTKEITPTVENEEIEARMEQAHAHAQRAQVLSVLLFVGALALVAVAGAPYAAVIVAFAGGGSLGYSAYVKRNAEGEIADRLLSDLHDQLSGHGVLIAVPPPLLPLINRMVETVVGDGPPDPSDLPFDVPEDEDEEPTFH